MTGAVESVEMGVEAVIATQVIDTTAVGRSVMTAADAAAARTALNLGTLATQSGTFSGTSSGTNTGDQDLSGYLTAVAAAAAYQVILVSGTNIKTVNGSTLLGSGDLTISGLSGTGSVDNAALRADGTGGATLQNSAWIISDNLTASPNNTVNHACLEATGGTTNVSVSIKPKGTGAFCLAAPDGTATGGNVRGTNAIDLQTFRGAAAQVASGNYSVVIGSYNTASGSYSRAIGHNNTASGGTCLAVGHSCTASADDTVAIGSTATASAANGVAIGNGSTASGNGGVAIGSTNTASSPSAVAIGLSCTASGLRSRATGWASLADRYGQTAHSAGSFAATGDAQRVEFVARNKTTNNTATTLFLDGSSTRLTIPSGKILLADVLISGVKSDGSAAACYKRKVAIKNVGGTTSLVGSIETIGTDIEDNASTDVAITADNTNDALQINVTGITAETWRWVAVVEGLEIAYGT